MDLNFASTFVSSSLDQVVAESTVFPIELTQIVNQTDPLSSDGLPIFSAIWSYSFSVNIDELFTNGSRYTFFYRTQTNISVTIAENIFYVSNLQQPIARQTETIFRSLLFTIVVLEVFGLLFLLVKLLLVPMFRTILNPLYQKLPRKIEANPADHLLRVAVENSNLADVNRSTFAKKKPLRRWSTLAYVKHKYLTNKSH